MATPPFLRITRSFLMIFNPFSSSLSLGFKWVSLSDSTSILSYRKIWISSICLLIFLFRNFVSLIQFRWHEQINFRLINFKSQVLNIGINGPKISNVYDQFREKTQTSSKN
jgi:hypothetical protein